MPVLILPMYYAGNVLLVRLRSYASNLQHPGVFSISPYVVSALSVIPAKAGIYYTGGFRMDSRFRGNDTIRMISDKIAQSEASQEVLGDFTKYCWN